MSKLKDGVELNINEIVAKLDSYNVVVIQTYTLEKIDTNLYSITEPDHYDNTLVCEYYNRLDLQKKLNCMRAKSDLLDGFQSSQSFNQNFYNQNEILINDYLYVTTSKHCTEHEYNQFFNSLKRSDYSIIEKAKKQGCI
jgi:hypothetical protein